MTSFLELQQMTRTLMEQSGQCMVQSGYPASAARIREQMNAFEKRELLLVAAGEARRGKSTLLNALLNEKDSIFPADINVCTNVVTIARYGETEKIQVYIEEDNGKQGYRVEQITRGQIGDYVSEKGNPDNYKKVRTVSVEIPNDFLREGVVVVDTPGAGSLNREHEEITCSFLPKADILLFVTDADSGLTENELNFLKRAFSYCQNIIFPLTKKDLNADYPVIAEDDRNKIAGALEISKEQVQVIPVSSTAKLRYLRSGSKVMYQNSNFQELEDVIWDTVAKRQGEVLLLPYMNSVKMELLKVVDRVAAQYQTLGNDAALTLVGEFESKIAGMEKLQEDGAQWRSQLTLFFAALGTRVNGEQQRIVQEARDHVAERIHTLDTKVCKPKQYKALLGEVNDIITRGVLEIQNMMGTQMNQTMDKMEAELGFYTSTDEILKGIQFQPDSSVTVIFPKKKWFDSVIQKSRVITIDTGVSCSIGSYLGAAVGTIPGVPGGTALGAELGAVIGGMVGATKGCLDAFAKYNQVDVNAVSRTLNQHITVSMNCVANVLSMVQTQMRIMITAFFEKELKQSLRELKDDADRIKRNTAAAKAELPKKKEALKQQNLQLQKLVKGFETLEEKVLAVSPGKVEKHAAGAASTECTYDFL